MSGRRVVVLMLLAFVLAGCGATSQRLATVCEPSDPGGGLRARPAPEESEKGENANVLRDADRARLTLDRVQRKLGGAGFERSYAKTRQLPVDYAPGWAPGVE